MQNTKIQVKDRRGRHYDFEWVQVPQTAGDPQGEAEYQLRFDDPLFDKVWVIAKYTVAGDLIRGECFRYDTSLLPNQTRDEELMRKILTANALTINGLEVEER